MAHGQKDLERGLAFSYIFILYGREQVTTKADVAELYSIS